MSVRRTQPYSADELRQMLRDGDTVALIITRARRLDPSLSRDQVRAFLFDEVPA